MFALRRESEENRNRYGVQAGLYTVRAPNGKALSQQVYIDAADAATDILANMRERGIKLPRRKCLVYFGIEPKTITIYDCQQKEVYLLSWLST